MISSPFFMLVAVQSVQGVFEGPVVLLFGRAQPLLLEQPKLNKAIISNAEPKRMTGMELEAMPWPIKLRPNPARMNRIKSKLRRMDFITSMRSACLQGRHHYKLQ